jgi:hypothetical protein
MKGNVFEDLVAGLQKADASRARMWLVPKRRPETGDPLGLAGSLRSMYERMRTRSPMAPPTAGSVITPINWGGTLLGGSIPGSEPYRITYP